MKFDYGTAASASTLATEYFHGSAREESLPFPEVERTESNLSIIVVGASGELAETKIFPALFALFYEDRLPEVSLHHCLMQILLFRKEIHTVS